MSIKLKDNNKLFSVYMHTTPNGKRYIGISTNVKKRWSERYKGQLFGKAVKKYGWDNIKHEILFENLTKEDACAREKVLIAHYKTTDKNYGYNVSTGGDINFFEHPKASEETKKKMSEAQKKRYAEHPLTEEQRKRMAETCRKIAKKRVYTPEMRKRISDAHKGKPNLHCRGKKLPEWQKQFISQINSGANAPRARKVICLDTMKIYDTIRFGAIDTNSREANIGAVCRGQKLKTNGLHWAFYDKTKDDKYYNHLLKVVLSLERPSLEKKVMCIETGVIYSSMREAYDKVGAHQSEISKCCNGKGITAGGYHWKFAQ